MEALGQVFFNTAIMARVWPFLLQGFGTTLMLSALVIPLGLAGGLAVALASRHDSRLVRGVQMVYVDFFRAFPPLVLLIFIYFGFPFAGLDMPKLAAVALGFFLNTSSYYGEILRAGIESVSRGQMDAALSMGLTRRQAYRHVILPQAIKNVLPDLISNTIEVVKLTTLASVVALPELLNNARQAQALTYNPTPIVLAALMYLALLWPLVRLLSRLEHKHLATR
ncbi:MAG: amino acid ABC transporter permease [Burkholderiales bacterium]